ncbi:ComEA family DNA-binding protein [Ruminococcaceae bacterium OttesenSCG-928-O06]|nr:ComEA family DNA-binding protein [Ruminococcaceae bacterium OttesenSCG-928-O06]
MMKAEWGSIYTKSLENMKNSANKSEKIRRLLTGRSGYTLLALLAGAVVLVVAFLWYPPFLAGAAQKTEDSTFFAPGPDLVNANTASLEELTVLPGIGATRAEAIVAYREEHGPFQSVEELLQVPGIGAGVLEGIFDKLTI